MAERTPAGIDFQTYYDEYFDSPEQLDWYALNAIDKARHVMERTGSVAHDKIVDIGCGDGAVLLALDRANYGTELTAVDVSASGLAAVEKKPFRHLKQTQQYDGYLLPFETDTFDLAILSHVVEHVEHPRMLLYEAARVARHLYVEVPLELRWFERGIRPNFVLDESGHINYYSPKQIRLLLQTSGLEVVQQKTVNFSKAVFKKGSRYGSLAYYVKQAALGLSESLATGCFTYASSILCRQIPDGARGTVPSFQRGVGFQSR